jgi:hypothetical protein
MHNREDRPVLSSAKNLEFWTPAWELSFPNSTVVVERVESLERIANERQAQLGGIVARLITGLCCESLQMSSVVCLINFIRWEVGRINVGRKLGLEWCSNAAQAIKVNTTEELVCFDLISTSPTQTILSVADETFKAS